MGISMMEFLCSYTIVMLAHISFTSLLNSVDGVGSVGAWFRGWNESNVDRGHVGRVSPKSFGVGQK